MRRAILLLLGITALLLACGGGAAAMPPKGPMPPGASWEGTWETSFGPLVIGRKDGKLVGAYKYGSIVGILVGREDGNYLHFVWTEQEGGAGTGRGVFAMDGTGQSFSGTWGTGESESGGGTWTGHKKQ